MTQFDYPRARAAAERLIAKFGMPGALRRSTPSGPANAPIITDTDHACTLAVLDYEDARIDGTLIRRSDRLVYLSTAGLGVAPDQSDRIIAGEIYVIVRLRPLSPAGVVVYYEVQVRR